MKTIEEKLQTVDWKEVAGALNEKGFAIIPQLLSAEICNELIDIYQLPTGYRKKVVMERYRYGKGEYKYFDYPLPPVVQTIRQTVYPQLAPVANHWMQILKINTSFPGTLDELHALCKADNQTKPTALILKYEAGGFNTLHQDLYGDVYFPMQTVLFLNQPNDDFTGGEFVLIEQVPRAQSKAIVLQPQKGDMLIFTTNFRPAKGSKGYYRANMKHGVSEVHSGNRHTLGIIFHDAVS